MSVALFWVRRDGWGCMGNYFGWVGEVGGGWSIILGEMGSVGKYLGWEWVGWGQCGSVHCLIMPNFNCVCVKR